MIKAFDKKMFMTFYRFARARKHVGVFFLMVSLLSVFVFPVLYAFLLFWLALNNRYNDIPAVITAPALTLFMSMLLKRIFKRNRPNVTYGLKGNRPSLASKIGKKWPVTGSFPSNHAASAFIIAISCHYISFELFAAVSFLALITSVSRVFNGVHYVSDVVGGLVLSGFAAIVGYSFLPSVLHNIFGNL